MSLIDNATFRALCVGLALAGASAPAMAQEVAASVTVTLPREVTPVDPTPGAIPESAMSADARAALDGLVLRTTAVDDDAPAPVAVAPSDEPSADREGRGHRTHWLVSERAAENRIRRLAERLSLNASQIDSVREIVSAARREARALPAAHRAEARRAIEARTRAAIEAVLTAEQRAELSAPSGERGERSPRDESRTVSAAHRADGEHRADAEHRNAASDREARTARGERGRSAH